MINSPALDVLFELDEGQVFNVAHRFARELIALDMAIDDGGRLRITELGRLTVRHAVRSYPTADEHHANLDPDWPPIDRKPNTWWRNSAVPVDLKRAPPVLEPGPHMMKGLEELPPAPEVLPPAAGPLAWDRARVIRAAGIANGKTGTWVDPAWIDAFMEAYEGR